jgi:hypothetical protein
MEKYKTMNQLQLETKICSSQCFCDGSCKKPLKDLGNMVTANEREKFCTIGNNLNFESKISAKKIKTIEELVLSTHNDQELGEKIRKIFSDEPK